MNLDGYSLGFSKIWVGKANANKQEKKESVMHFLL